MSIESLISMFRTAPTSATVPQQWPANPSQVNQPGVALATTQSGDGTANNGVVPTQQQTEQSPFDGFKDLWQTVKTGAEDTGPMFANVKPEDMIASAGKVDFAKIISPSIMADISAGGDKANAAFTAAMNSVAQNVYAQSAFATTQIVDKATQRMQEQFNKQLPSLITKNSVTGNLAEQNPLLSNPAVVPIVEALKEQLIRKNPNATSAEITTQITDFMGAMAAFAPKPLETPASRRALQAAKGEDWDKFLG